ncbi:hypothetical protein F7Q99_28140 [Streptomyces kaniharaensis]|uniref:Uncharacterized protein n=1 Tax=Streptomyces kaniharaensis TaxID=212423 RepID=A0A6N7L1F9_9ACTN|nr:hypothetical protein [Streptomyces kaniharaensis]MQS16014.1 hypothetical protein [Streptomyces kaniharaensis]
MTASAPLHHGAGLARGWTEKDVDGLDGWVALVEGRVVLGARPGGGVPETVVHAEAWQVGATLHAALAQHPGRPEQAPEEDDDQEHGLLGGVRNRVRRRAAGMTRENLQEALHRAREDERAADRYADPGDETAHATAATACAEWQRVRDHTAETRAERYDPNHDTAHQHALRRERHRQDVAECAREAAQAQADDTGRFVTLPTWAEILQRHFPRRIRPDAQGGSPVGRRGCSVRPTTCQRTFLASSV